MFFQFTQIIFKLGLLEFKRKIAQTGDNFNGPTGEKKSNIKKTSK